MTDLLDDNERAAVEAEVADLIFSTLREAGGAVSLEACRQLSPRVVSAVLHHTDLRRVRTQWQRGLVEQLNQAAEQETANYQQACRWVEHFKNELQQIADRHGVSVTYVTEFAQKEIRGKVGQARRGVREAVEDLILRHPLWSIWSSPPPSEPVPVRLTCKLSADEDVQVFRRWRDDKDSHVDQVDLAQSGRSGMVLFTATVGVHVGDVLAIDKMRAADRAETKRRMSEWSARLERGEEPNALPERLPSETVHYVRAPKGQLVRLDHGDDSQATRDVLDYIYHGRLSLNELVSRAEGRSRGRAGSADVPWLVVETISPTELGQKA